MKKVFLLFVFCFLAGYAQTIKYPEARKTEQTDNYFGTVVADPYRWLEDETSAETKEWISQQVGTTEEYLAAIPYRNAIKEKIESYMNYPRYGLPFREGKHYYFYKNDGLQNQFVLYRQEGLDGKPEVFLDPNTFSEDGTVGLRSLSFSKNGNLLAYGISRGGADWRELFVMDTRTGKKYRDSLAWVKFSGAAWFGNGFYYSRYDAPADSGKQYSEKNKNHKIYYHILGENQSQDKLYHQDTSSLIFNSVSISDDERFIYLFKSGQGRGNGLYYRKLRGGGRDFIPINKDMAVRYSPVDNEGDIIIVYTNHNAPNGKVIAVNTAKKGAVSDLIPEQEYVLDGVTTGGGKIFVTYMADVKHIVKVYNYKGVFESEVTLPDPGTVSGFDGKKDDKVLFYSFTSFTYPNTIFRYDVKTGTSELFKQSEVKFNPEDYVTEQVFYQSKDGTKIPMFIVHKKGIKLDGTNPALLYGYGGFNVALNPSFSASRIPWLELGGIYVMANLRGGSEYGEKWHEGGMLLNKQNVFDDFIAAAEYLINNKYTSPERLAIQGGSNGGLLVGAVMCQRPELFGVAIPEVGVMDMLRYHKFTIGWNWASDYGTSDDSVNFVNLYNYSPLHNLKDGVKYPSTLVTTADRDDRVVPAHSYKFAARLQAAHKGDNPVLIRIDTKSGHGASSTTKGIEKTADIYSFILYNMNFTPEFR
ncbi:MAG: S9 family peptidase [Ignavibacteriaceae bacterium]|nr:S9 family peptidase [Ignavibacteriaceae bacterium]